MAVAVMCVTAPSCTNVAPARPQLLFYIDTNTPVVDQLAAHPELSSDATVDSVHVEVLSDNGDTIEARDITAPDPIDWPVSFGIIPDRGAGQVLHVRVRAYNSAFVLASDDTTLAASASVIIDRLVDVTSTGGGVEARHVVLSGDCFGARPTFATVAAPKAVTCVDAGNPAGAPTDGVVTVDGTPAATTVGTWALAIEQSCPGTAPSGTVCIDGGVTFLGDLSLAGYTDGATQRNSAPLRPVALSPFYLDVDEFTVGRYRALVGAGKLAAPPAGSSTTDCTWLGVSDKTHDAFAMNCISRDLAATACAAVGGKLPTEARWEHAARGRGKRFTYPWGNDEPQCCSASYGRTAPNEVRAAMCPGSGPEATASHVAGGGCSGPVDVSSDGVVDLCGGMQEWTSEIYADYDDPCWGTAIALDTTCTPATGENLVARGGAWSSPPFLILSAMRFTPGGLDGADIGFRCAYEASP